MIAKGSNPSPYQHSHIAQNFGMESTCRLYAWDTHHNKTISGEYVNTFRVRTLAIKE